jgi:hypothetical protein
MIQAGNPIARAAIVERRFDKLQQVLGIFHHMSVGIDVTIAHKASSKLMIRQL